MPSYTYVCEKCGTKTEIFTTIQNYKEHISCACGATMGRYYQDDLVNMLGSVIKSDSELKTLGDLANRNRDRMSDDHKAHLHKKHNEYKAPAQQKELPKGMTRMKKSSQKFQWPK